MRELSSSKPPCKRKGKGQGAPQAHVAESSKMQSQGFVFTCQMDVMMTIRSGRWMADSASTTHVAQDRGIFHDWTPTPGARLHGIGEAPVIGRGTVWLEMVVDGKPSSIMLTDVCCVPTAPHNLISISRLTDAGGKALFTNDTVLFSHNNTMFARGTKAALQLYEMDVHPIPPAESNVTMSTPSQACTWDQWHHAYGHVHLGALQQMVEKNSVAGMNVNTLIPAPEMCVTCVQVKHQVSPFPKESNREYRDIGEVTFTDLWGPAQTTVIGGYRYVQTFKDGKSHRVSVHFLKDKTDESIIDALKTYHLYVLTQKGMPLKRLRANNEFASRVIHNWCWRNGVHLELTAPHLPKQNSVAERHNCAMIEMACAMLIAKDLPKHLWAEAVAYSCYLRNRTITRSLKGYITPHKMFWQQKPNVSMIQEFGSPCWVLQQDGQQQKLDAKSREFIFVGFSENSHAYHYYNTATRQVHASRNVVFLPPGSSSLPMTETLPSLPHLDVAALYVLPDVTQDPVEALATTEAPETKRLTAPAPTRHTRELPPLHEPSSRLAGKPQQDYRSLHNPYHGQGDDNETSHIVEYVLLTTLLTFPSDPVTIADAKNSDEWPEWQHAMDAEIGILNKLKTWELTEQPPGRRIIQSKWVFQAKYGNDGQITKYKAHLIARGFTQVPSVDSTDTFAPAVHLDTLHILLVIAAHEDLELHHVDIKLAYLNGKLTEEIFMEQPLLYDDRTTRVCHLLKSIYGLKQAGRVWNTLLNHSLTDLGFTWSLADPCLYHQLGGKSGSVEFSLIGVYVDDMTIVTLNADTVARIKDEIRSKFEISNLGSKIIGCEVKHDWDEGMMAVTQSQYINVLLSRFGMKGCKMVETPLNPGARLQQRDTDDPDIILCKQYSALIGSLLYVACGSRPDISFTVQMLSQFSLNPSKQHLTAAKRVLRYLKRTVDMGITYCTGREPLSISAFSDSDWGVNVLDCKSISVYVFQLAGGPIAGVRRSKHLWCY